VSGYAVTPVAGERLLGRTIRSAREWVPAVAVFVLGIALWEGLVAALDVQRFLLPPPSNIIETFWDERSVLWNAGWYTFKEALGGFAIGCTAGVLVAMVVARSARQSCPMRSRRTRSPSSPSRRSRTSGSAC
jgi:ABC-type nitrate/sulfonate/bicarbonate transport system permease component